MLRPGRTSTAGQRRLTVHDASPLRLPPFLGAGFLPPVPYTPAVRPIAASAAPSLVRRAAGLAAAAALGLLAGFGAREGAPLIVLGTAGLRLRGLPEFVTPDRGVDVTTLLGALHAGLVAYGWGLLAATVARRLRGWRAVAALAVVAAVLASIDPLLPAVLRLGAGAPSTGERVLCALVLAAAAGLGTRLAPPRRVAEPAPAVERRHDARHAVAADADVMDLRESELRDASDEPTRELPVGLPHAAPSADAGPDSPRDPSRHAPMDVPIDVADDHADRPRVERPIE